MFAHFTFRDESWDIADAEEASVWTPERVREFEEDKAGDVTEAEIEIEEGEGGDQPEGTGFTPEEAVMLAAAIAEIEEWAKSKGDLEPE